MKALEEGSAIRDARTDRWLGRALGRLERHGVAKRRLLAFAGIPRWPALREPADDPVEAAFADERDPSKGAGSRQPWAVASGADAG